MLSLYNLCLRQMLSIREHENLFAALVNLQIKNDPLDNPRHAHIWIAAASRNPAVLDWLVLNTEKTITQLVISVFNEALAGCCIEVMNWFSVNIRLELDETILLDNIVRNIMMDAACESSGDSDEENFRPAPLYQDYLAARGEFLRKDDEIMAHCLITNGFDSTYRLWMAVTHSVVAPKIAVYLANQRGYSYRKEHPKYSFYLKLLAKRKRPKD